MTFLSSANSDCCPSKLEVIASSLCPKSVWEVLSIIGWALFLKDNAGTKSSGAPHLEWLQRPDSFLTPECFNCFTRTDFLISQDSMQCRSQWMKETQKWAAQHAYYSSGVSKEHKWGWFRGAGKLVEATTTYYWEDTVTDDSYKPKQDLSVQD